MAKRDVQIASLEVQKENLDKQAGELTNAIAGLNLQITETQRKLAAAEGDKSFLEKELQRLMAEKQELEKKFNDLAVLREQVKQLKDDLAIARRIDWIRKGLWGGTEEKGAQRLMAKPTPPPMPPAQSNRFNLNVEIGSDGSVRVIPVATNQPPTNPPTAR